MTGSGAVEYIVEATNIVRTFPAATRPVEVLRGVDVCVSRGEVLAITGSSGSGKSTLMAILGLMDAPTSGSYLLEGTEVAHLNEARRCEYRCRRIGFVFQDFHLLGHRTALDNVGLAMLHRSDIQPRERNERAELTLQRVGLSHRAYAQVSTMSGGERQRCAIARAIVGGPSLVVADEPTGNLDQENAELVIDLLRAAADATAAVIIVTHDIDVAARCDRRLHLDSGVLHANS